jgi:hypothetical protein
MLTPNKYKSIITPDNNNCVIGSVEGVNTAPIIVAIKTTYFQYSSICLPEITPSTPITI